MRPWMVGVLLVLLPVLVRAQPTGDDEVALLRVVVRDAVGGAPFVLGRVRGAVPGCPGVPVHRACVVDATTRIGIRPPTPAQQRGFTDALARARHGVVSDSLLPVALWEALSALYPPVRSRADSARASCRLLAVSRVAVDSTGQFAIVGYEMRVGGAAQAGCGGDGYVQSQAALFQRERDGPWARVGTLAGVLTDVFAHPRRRARRLVRSVGHPPHRIRTSDSTHVASLSGM